MTAWMSGPLLSSTKRRLPFRSSRPRIVASATCYALRMHVSAPPRGGLTQALGLKTHKDRELESFLKYIVGFTFLGYCYLLLSVAFLLLALHFGRKDIASPQATDKAVVLEPISQVPGGYVTPLFAGDDGKGNKGKLRIFVLAQEHFWKCGSSLKVVGKDNPLAMIEYFQSPGLAPEFSKHSEIVIVGMASEEGASTDRMQQLALSKDRVRTIHEWVLQVPGIKKLSGLAIGAHKPTHNNGKFCAENPTHLQRRIVNIGVTPTSSNVDTSSLLRSALRNVNLPLNIDEYIDFEYWSIFNYTAS